MPNVRPPSVSTEFEAVVISGFSRESMLIIPDFQGYFTANCNLADRINSVHICYSWEFLPNTIKEYEM